MSVKIDMPAFATTRLPQEDGGDSSASAGAEVTETWPPTIRSIRRTLINGLLTPVEIIEKTFERIAFIDREIGAFRAIAKERALAKASDLGSVSERLPLYGIPFAVKDMIDVGGMPTTCQSRILPVPFALDDAWIVSRLESAGAICLGKLSMGEFSLGPERIRPGVVPVINPVDPTWTPGSTSTGSAAAVAAGLVPFSIGSDTGGSIRNPAMMTRTVGIKPTTGLIPMAGAFPLAPSLDTIGPIAASSQDLMDVMGVLTPASAKMKSRSRKRLKIGFVRHFHAADISASPDVVQSLDRMAGLMISEGHIVEEISLPPLADYKECGWTILLFEAAQVHKEWIENRSEDYHPDTLSQLMAGRAISPRSYQSALRSRARLSWITDQKIATFDLLMCAVSGHPGCRNDDEDGLRLIDETSLRIPFNVSGHPAVAVPAPLSRDGFPIGVQLIGKRGEDWELLKMAEVFERLLMEGCSES